MLQFTMEVIGWLGALAFLLSYFFLISGKWSSTSFIYHLFNILGGVMLTVNTIYYRSFSAAFINLAWALIAAYGVYKDQIRMESKVN